jgi:hypothetical protein
LRIRSITLLNGQLRSVVATLLLPMQLIACSSPPRDPVDDFLATRARTPTPLEQEDEEQRHGFLVEGDEHAWLARRGIRVTQPISLSTSGSDDLRHGCSPVFPVVGTSYGIYYLPSDELYRGVVGLYLALCFASEQDAINAGYRRGPHGPR